MSADHSGLLPQRLLVYTLTRTVISPRKTSRTPTQWRG